MIIGLVFTNVLYLIVALVVAVIGALVVVLRHRKPKSVEANVASFNRGLRALAPDRVSDDRPNWGGARRPSRSPAAMSRPSPPPEPVDDAIDRTDAPNQREAVGQEDPVEAAADGADGGAPEAGPEVGSAQDPASEPVHLASRKRRPVSHADQARRVDDPPPAPTEEAETG